MANENDTHEKVCEEMRAYAKKSKVDGGAVDVWNWLRDFAKRAESTHKREIEIASKYSAEHEARIFDAIRKRDAIIKELADNFDRHIGCAYIRCPNEVCAKCNIYHKCEIIRKAREVSNG